MTALHGINGIAAVIPRRRFWCEAGSDQIVMDGRPITEETAEGLIATWRKTAANIRERRFPGAASLRLAKWCETDADELEAALAQARNWRRCQDPRVNVGFGAFAESVATLTEGR